MNTSKTISRARIVLAVAIFAPFQTASADTITIGESRCATASVSAEIVDQNYIGHLPDPEGGVSVDGLFRMTLNVRRVIHGPLSAGPLEVRFAAHSELTPQRARFFLRRIGDAWWIAHC